MKSTGGGTEPLNPHKERAREQMPQLQDLTGELLVGLLVEASDLTTRELGRLACTAKHFRRELLEEVARLRVERLPAAQQEWAPRRARQRWLRVLKELEQLQRPLAFSTAGSSSRVQLKCGNACAWNAAWFGAFPTSGVTVYSNHVMRAGTHAATFFIQACGDVVDYPEGERGETMIGLVRRSVAEAGTEFATATPNGWGWSWERRGLIHSGTATAWVGQERSLWDRSYHENAKAMLGLQLDLVAGTLTASIDGKESR